MNNWKKGLPGLFYGRLFKNCVEFCDKCCIFSGTRSQIRSASQPMRSDENVTFRQPYYPIQIPYMKHFYQLFLITFFVFSPQILAQKQSIGTELQGKYQRFFELDRERVYLHLNKTTVIPGEDLWISAYVYNSRLGLPNQDTRDLQIEIFRRDGEHLDTKTFYISNGKGSGFISLDPKQYPPGKYFFRASTEYMKNFEEDLSYIQPFRIQGKEELPRKQEPELDLQLLPEGGHLLAQSLNSVGVKLLEKTGTGASFEGGKVLDSQGREITSFKSNRFGLSKFSFIPEMDETYQVVIETETGEQVHRMLPSAKPTGINIINTVGNKEHLLSIRTNERTRRSLDEAPLLLAVHKDGQLKVIPIAFPKDKLVLNVRMHKDSLFAGTNIITIFNQDLEPLVERMVFVENNIKRFSLNATSRRLKDSLEVKLRTAGENGMASLSISALPSATQAYQPVHNIISAMHLRPYLEGFIDDPAYYFSPGKEARKQYDLDLLLLTQGWSRYQWKDIFHNPPVDQYSHQRGFTIKGRIENRRERRHQNIFVSSEGSGLWKVADIEKDDSFLIEDAFLVEGSEISLGLMNDRNGKLSEPEVTVAVLPKEELQDLQEVPVMPEKKKYNDILFIPEAFPEVSNVIDTVEISDEKLTHHVFNPELQVHARGYKIDEKLAQQYHFITDFIASKGFQVRNIYGTVEIRSWRTMPGLGGVSRGNSTGYQANSNVLIYLNDVSIGIDPNVLNGMLTSQVESVIVNPMGHGYGGSGVNGVIRITTKKGGFVRDTRETIHELIASNGYTVHREFYVPKYEVIHSAAFERYGVVDWKPAVVVDQEGLARITIPDRGPVSLFIEGINIHGALISQRIDLKAGQAR